MNKNAVIIVIAMLVVIAAIIGVVFVVTSGSETKGDQDTSKALGTVINDEENINDLVETEDEDVEEDINNKDVIRVNLNEAGDSQDLTPENKKEKILIAYFSRADENYNVGTVAVGNTEFLASHIKNYLGEDVDAFKIETIYDYPKDYDECTKVAQEEKNQNARPEYKGNIDVSKYDTIFLGYPIWWGTVPMVVNTFLESQEFSGKTVYLFSTHEGSGNAGTFTHIDGKLTTANVDTNGLSMRGTAARENSAKDSVETWLKGLGY